MSFRKVSRILCYVRVPFSSFNTFWRLVVVWFCSGALWGEKISASVLISQNAGLRLQLITFETKSAVSFSSLRFRMSSLLHFKEECFQSGLQVFRYVFVAEVEPFSAYHSEQNIQQKFFEQFFQSLIINSFWPFFRTAVSAMYGGLKVAGTSDKQDCVLTPGLDSANRSVLGSELVPDVYFGFLRKFWSITCRNLARLRFQKWFNISIFCTSKQTILGQPLVALGYR